MSLIKRVAETQRPAITFQLNGQRCEALAGDTLLTAILSQQTYLRHNEFSQQPRAGFCLMGACQDCLIKDGQGRSLRACSTLVEAGMSVWTEPQPSPAQPQGAAS
ncbi:(2Fe-2S)-binding protein [Pokkaliibacter sp. MBI-7]|uniref:(2Fe-2S)-binding protein n=1 Tax=Pokkaliibacter sp. MBI-7 TaxID=3040600 RepID=UPI00244A1961|nr:(2Fe-2S)-binding protein [Pokkaliibacter sp. MBI-7]MDH2433028.1 (2Fe-2S)-binding protein [Pokkaliibacter sp. MBI-7]